jgi:hypothetical protein
MTCPSVISRHYKTREQAWGYLASRGFQRTRGGGGTAVGPDASAATTAAAGSRLGCRPFRTSYTSESVS